MDTVRIENKVKTAMFIIKNCSDDKRQLSAIIELIYECRIFKKACEDAIAIAENRDQVIEQGKIGNIVGPVVNQMQEPPKRDQS